MSVYFSKSYLSLAYVFSILMGISANSYFSVWFFLEINMMVFVYLIYLDAPDSNWELLLKYFIIQSLSSMLFLGASLGSTSESFLRFSVIISFSILVKLGSAPFHWWVVDIANKSSWGILFLLTTLQKILPLFLLDSFSPTEIKYIFIYSNLIIGVALINQVLLKSLMVYSSIFNLSWMMLISGSQVFWKLYILYLFVSGLVVLEFYKTHSLKMADLSRVSPSNKNLLVARLVNLAGLPPFPGFFLKFFCVSFFISISWKGLTALFLLLSALSFFGYLKMILQQVLVADYWYFEKSEDSWFPFSSFLLMASFLIILI